EAARVQETQRLRCQPAIAAKRVVDSTYRADELRRVEHDQAEALVRGDEAVDRVEHVGLLERHAGQSVQLGVATGQLQRGLGRIDAQDRARPGPRRVQGEAAAVAEAVEHL